MQLIHIMRLPLLRILLVRRPDTCGNLDSFVMPTANIAFQSHVMSRFVGPLAVMLTFDVINVAALTRGVTTVFSWGMPLTMQMACMIFTTCVLEDNALLEMLCLTSVVLLLNRVEVI